MSDSSRPHGLQPTRLLRPWDFPGKRTGVGSLNFSCIFWIQASILFPQSWIMFTVITLNYFSDRWLIFSVSISCRFLSGSFVCNVFLCCFILADLLYLWSPFYRLPANAGDTGDMGSIPGLGRSPGEGNGNPLQYSCLENPMDGGAWATVYGIAKSQT